MQRIVQGRSATITHTFSVGGTPTDPAPDQATVTITRADGQVLVPSTNATEAGTGKVSFTLTPVQAALLDVLTVTWTASFGGQPQTFTDIVEVAGDVLFTIAQARDARGDQSLDEGKIADARLFAETELEKAIRYALVPRYARKTVSSVKGQAIDLGAYARKVRTMTVGGLTLTPDELALLTIDSGLLRGYHWPTAYSNVVIGYEHGLDAPTPGATDAALALALDKLGGTGSIDPRAESIITVDGTIRLRTGGQFPTAGVDAWIEANRMPTAG
jgi:hypothetical protein